MRRLTAALAALAVAILSACSSPAEPVGTTVVSGPTVTVTVTSAPVPAPTVTVTKTPKPRPTKTVYVTQPASRGQQRPSVARGAWSQGEWGRFPAYVETAALCVAHHESWGTHNGRRLWTALNLAGSSASGFAQWIDSTWRVNAARAGVKVTSRAVYAPPRDQATVFAWMWTHGGKKAWRGTNCPGTD